ncbi:MAG: fumarylacetoacetate hydrolase family protein [Candidatus Bathyarchaeota archaeon]|nr:fumarylacetoacetate hydrolase family protein [Candidatus Bathyarchaeota archaeon]
MKYLRIVSSQTKSEGSYGILKGDIIHLLSDPPLSAHSNVTDITCALDEVKKFLPPIQSPNIIALGLNYTEHANESKMDLPSAPIIFLKTTSALTGHLQPIILPSEAPSEVDYEAELTIVIGKSAKNISENEAFDYIFGYTCGNDVSARDCQLRLDKQWARGKSFDTFASVGPIIETELNPSNLNVQCLLNGNIMQNGSTSDLIFNVPQIVSYLSRQMTLLPGTLIMTGTPPGVGFVREPPVFLKPNDRVEVKIEGIGTLENSVIAED